MQSGRYAFAAALTTGIVYSIITLALTYAREASLGFLAHIHFMESFGPFADHIAPSFSIFVSGLAQVMIYSYVIALLFLVLAGKLCGCCSSSCGPQKPGCCK